MSFVSRYLQGSQLRWEPLVGQVYANLIARDQLRRLRIALLAGLCGAVASALLIAIAAINQNILLVAVGAPAAVSAAVIADLLILSARPTVGFLITANLWRVGVPVVATLPTSRPNLASAWMRTNHIGVDDLVRASDSSTDSVADEFPVPRSLKVGVWLATIGSFVFLVALGSIVTTSDARVNVEIGLVPAVSA